MKGSQQSFVNFIAVLTYAGTYGGKNIFRLCAVFFFHPFEGDPAYLSNASFPAGMGHCDHMIFLIVEHKGYAVGVKGHNGDSRDICHQTVYASLQYSASGIIAVHSEDPCVVNLIGHDQFIRIISDSLSEQGMVFYNIFRFILVNCKRRTHVHGAKIAGADTAESRRHCV